MINVSKSFLPPIDKYIEYLKGIWDRGHLTNHGPLVFELEEKLKQLLGVKHLFFTNNGTIALQIAIKALDVTGEVITTPFSYVATTSSIVWENATPVFVDISPDDYTLDVSKIEGSITEKTSAILATHVFGIPCNVDAINEIARKHNLKVIYDAAHAFGVQYDGRSVLNYGDISTLSFHATKLFHTVEGGAIVTNDDDLAHKISFMRNFGHKGQEEFWGLGINGKNSEFHAAMGLSIFSEIDHILENRKYLSETYDSFLADMNIQLERPKLPLNIVYNYAYYPVVFESEKQLRSVKDSLNAEAVYPRRYFYPSLSKLPYAEKRAPMNISESISERILCLPLYNGLSVDNIRRICTVISKVLKYN